MGVTMFYAAALLYAALDLITCSVQNTSSVGMPTFEIRNDYKGVTGDPNLGNVALELPQDDLLTSANVEPESADRLSSEIFPAKIIDLLSPEMFSQSDPVSYFLEKTTILPYGEIIAVEYKLRGLLTFQRDEFPPRYLPYAIVLADLLKCQHYLEYVRRAIFRMQRSSGSVYPTPAAGLVSPELSELFSSDVFSDDRPPFRLITRLLNTPDGKIPSFRSELKNIFYKKKIPVGYEEYITKLNGFFTRDFLVPRLKASVSKLRDIISGKLTFSDGLRLRSDRVSKVPDSEIPSANVPAASSSAASLANENDKGRKKNNFRDFNGFF